MFVPDLGSLSSTDKGTSKIIDANFLANYAFLDVPVGFCIRFDLRFLDAPYDFSTDKVIGHPSGCRMSWDHRGMENAPKEHPNS